jgi:hypothetical protein
MSGPEKSEAYRRLFLDEAGGLKPHARLVLEDLLNFTRFFQDPRLETGRDLWLIEGGRACVRRLLRLSGAGGQILNSLLKGDEK